MTYLMNQIQNLIQISKQQEQQEPYYEILEYIETDGTQYYKTGEILSSTSKVECRASVLGAATSTGSAYIFGAYGASKNFGINKASSTGCFCVWGSNSTVFTPALDLDTFYDISLSSDGLYVDGSKVLTPSGIFTGANEAYISWANGTSQPVAKIKLACLKIYQSGVLTKDYIPVLDNQMRPCLYDKVSKTFLYHTNSEGSTSPSFKRWNKFDVDYIQSSGTQYINTGYAFADDFAYEVEYEGLNNGECLLGGRTSSIRTAILYRAMATQVDGQTTVPIAGLNATQTPFKLGVLSDTKHKVKVSIANNKGNVWLDDTQIYTNQSFTGTYISGKTTAIFADHFGDQTGTSEYQEYATSKLYALKFWQGTTLVRDYKPVVWHNGDTTAVACLYDEVYNKMYQNAGTGSFKAYITNISTTKTNVFTTTDATSGKAINSEGQIINSSASSYSALLPIVGGTVIECVSGNTGNNNYRFHTYDSSGNWIEQSLVLYPEGAGTVEPVTGSFTAPANAKYVRVSYATQASSTIQVKSATETIYEVGTSITTTKSGTSTVTTAVTSGCYIDLGIEANDVMIINGKTTTTSTGSNYYSGCRAKKPTGDTNNPPILFAVSGSATGSKVSATVNNISGLAKSYNNNNVATDWERTGNYTYQLTISAYQKNNLTYFKAIGYSYTLDKEMIPVDETQAICTITSGGETNTYNTIADVPDKYKSNILFGAIKVVDNGTGTSENNILASNNTHYFYELYEQGQPIVRFLPVRNATNTSTIGMFNTVNRTFTQFTKVLVSNLTITYSFTALS